MDRLEMTIVGAGGVFWQGLPRLRTWISRRADYNTEVVVYDPDSLEERNAARQWWWPLQMDEVPLDRQKATMAWDLLEKMGVGADGIVQMAGRKDIRVSEDETEVTVVIVLSDNHTARYECLKGAEEMACKNVLYATAGNDPAGGWAYVGWVRKDGEKTGWGDRMLERHQDIEEEVKKEAEEEVMRREGCGSVAEVVVGQSEEGNDLTAYVLWCMLEKVWLGESEGPGEMYWKRDEEGKVTIWQR